MQMKGYHGTGLRRGAESGWVPQIAIRQVPMDGVCGGY